MSTNAAKQMDSARPSAKLITLPARKRKPKTRERIRGEGTIFLRGNVYWYEMHWHGERFRGSLDTPDRETALMKWDTKRAEIRSGEVPKTFAPITVQSMFDIWIQECERTCKPSTVDNYRRNWDVHLKPVFGKLLATQVNKDRVAAYLHHRMKDGAGEVTQNRENRVLQMIFNYNKSKIAANNFPEFPDMHSEKNHVRKGRLSVKDYGTLISRLDSPDLFWLKVILVMTFKYGFRKAELVNAKVGYFDREGSVFTLPAFTTKNKMERRVPVKRSGEIYKMLVQLTEGRDKEEPLFTRNGKAVRDYRGAWEKITEGITNGRGGHVTIHDLRRSAITMMSNKGITAVQAGTHLTPNVFDRYISRSAEEEQTTAALIEE